MRLPSSCVCRKPLVPVNAVAITKDGIDDPQRLAPAISRKMLCNGYVPYHRDTQQRLDVWIVWQRLQRIPEKITKSISPIAIFAPIC